MNLSRFHIYLGFAEREERAVRFQLSGKGKFSYPSDENAQF